MKKVSSLFKELSDKQLKENLRGNQGLYLFKYSGVNSADLTKLRRNLTSVGAKMFVTKNSFINLALKSINKGKDVLGFIDGPMALVFIKDDPVSPAKVLTDFAKAHESISLKGGYINDGIIQSKDFKILANIPPRQVLYQQVAMAINGPLSKLAISLNQVMAKLAYVLKALSDNKEKEKK
ncbi:MAG: 50S ribosomal protein L10 [Candidatus Omnitrophica bacterium]|nr:50S ribosomal protein L10 [Candidatus Omnitrophota bacterium]MDD5352192.1 50S ribosomal protein L10 [Candidatus Omnitrophota bacterium]MDD5549790.1 50S ribosomal protein L10 [Candidatus Omnitrophota bacterium]